MSFSRVRTITTIALSATAVLAVPAGTAVAKKKAPKYPVITKVTPMQVGVGDLLTIKGKGFRSGKNKNTVVFKRFGQRAIFVKAESATKTAITLHVPLKLQAYMKVANNQPVPSVFAIRIISKRFGQRFTSRKLSPTVGPAGSGITAPGITPPSAYEQCLSTAQSNPAGDEDKDGLSNGLEKGVGTDPCSVDTDTDGLSDGWEYQSASDLNPHTIDTTSFYPANKPWPNPRDPSDANYDFDGDGLSASQEFALWQAVGSPFNADSTLGAYSDGHQSTGPAAYDPNLDLDQDGNLSDDERDADGDGLSNMVEFNTEGTQDWWAHGPYKDEKPYSWRVFAQTSATVKDSDGDGVSDGADDQDADGVDNFTEMQLGRARSGYLVQPFNPCLPNPWSLTCGRYVPLDASSAWPPFDTTYSSHIGKAVPFTIPDTDPAPGQPGWNGKGGPQGS